MGSRTPLVAANWKMHKTPDEAVRFLDSVENRFLELEGVDVILCVSYTSLFVIRSRLDRIPVKLGAQNMFHESEGAYTGEISPAMLKASGVSWVILGHSERRRLFAETDLMISRKIKAALKNGLNPIICVGESLSERKKGRTEDVLKSQLNPVLDSVGQEHLRQVVLAYEPLWAIGTGVNASSQEVASTHRGIRKLLSEKFKGPGEAVRILYGGSVTTANAGDLISAEGVDGFLVGGASLDAESFFKIVKTVQHHEARKGR